MLRNMTSVVLNYWNNCSVSCYGIFNPHKIYQSTNNSFELNMSNYRATWGFLGLLSMSSYRFVYITNDGIGPHVQLMQSNSVGTTLLAVVKLYWMQVLRFIDASRDLSYLVSSAVVVTLSQLKRRYAPTAGISVIFRDGWAFFNTLSSISFSSGLKPWWFSVLNHYFRMGLLENTSYVK